MQPSINAVRDHLKMLSGRQRTKDALASLLLATPLLIVFFDNSVSPSPWTSLSISGTLFVLGTVPEKLRRFHRLEFALPLFFPSIATAILCAFVLFLQAWKEAKASRHHTDDTRSALVSSLGLRPAGERIVAISANWGIAGTLFFWLEELLSRTLMVPTQMISWLSFLAFASGLASMLTSPHGVVKPRRETREGNLSPRGALDAS